MADEEGGEAQEVTDLSSSDVCTKYQEASKIVNLTLEGLVGQCVVGAKVVDLCNFGTSVMEAAASKLYTKKDSKGEFVLDRGVAFPVCISVNDIVCNNSPLASEDLEPLKAGDVVKMDLGCHLDGYIAVAAHTIIVSAEKVEGEDEAAFTVPEEQSNVAVAAYNAMLVAAHAISAGKTNTSVTKAVERVADHYGVNAISSVRMHQMKRYVLDSVKEVSLREPTAEELDTGEQEKLEECSFEQFEVYAVDVAMSTGDGKAKTGDMRTTVFKRNVETNYRLKLKASRYVFTEVDKKFPTLPFTLRHFDDETQAKMGINELVSHGLVTPYPVLYEKKDATVVHFKCTVLLLPSGTTRVTGLDLPSYFVPQKEPDEETAKVLQELAEIAAKKAKKKAAKKKKKKAAAAAASS